MYKAKLLPLSSKYYGTEVMLENGSIITFWIPDELEDNMPSVRELAKFNATEQDWLDNNTITNVDMKGKKYKCTLKETGAFDDSHYEDKHSLKIAEAFIEMYNAM